MKLIIALAQLELSRGNPDQNLAKTAEWTSRAAKAGADLILFPELWISGYDIQNAGTLADSRHGGTFRELKNMSHQQGISIAGSILEKAPEGIFNTFVLYQPDGSPPAFYRKTHLFQMLEEHKWLQQGNQLCAVTTRWGRFGLAICYDLRFPEMFQRYSQFGTELVLISAVWPQSRIVHWQKLLQARAIENQSFFAAVNRVGFLGEEPLGGSSAVVNPLGELLNPFSDQEELIIHEIDLREVRKVRKWMTVLQDRRQNLYRQQVQDCCDDY